MSAFGFDPCQEKVRVWAEADNQPNCHSTDYNRFPLVEPQAEKKW
jgi:hypothetical protein